MTYLELEKAARSFYPAIALDRVFRPGFRKFLGWFFGITLVLLLIPAVIYVWPGLEMRLAGFGLDPRLIEFLAGCFFLILPVWLIPLLFSLFRNSFMYKGFDHVLSEVGGNEENPISFEAASFCFFADRRDLTGSFFGSGLGRLVMLRLGLNEDELGNFLSGDRTSVKPELFQVAGSEDGKIRFGNIASAIFKQDTALQDFLFSRGVQEGDFNNVVGWVSRDIMAMKKARRWWSKDNLGRVPGIGKDWSYGGAYRLRRYSAELTEIPMPEIENEPQYLKENIEKLEAVLSKKREANALLVGEDGGGKNEVLNGFVKQIQTGKIFPQLEHKRVFALDTTKLVAETGEKARFEMEAVKMFGEAVESGNCIIVIEDLPGFVQSVSNIGSNLSGIMSPYLSSAEIQFIAMASPGAFHKTIESNGELLEKFDVMMLKEGEASELIQTLEQRAAEVEAREGVIFSEPALMAIAESAERYITEGVMPDKAIDLMFEIAAKARTEKKKAVGKADVMDFVKSLTGIPTGSVSAEEKDKLLNLEKILHERVIGQEEAVSAISNAMRRARAGVESPNRPMGSFLFMGPTGVGKTETTKALAEVFFGDEKRVMRLDMSEYKGPDAMNKLIGSFESGTPGVLSSMLREKPYGVLLLDEFEKTTKDVMDLFLQVLDEGFFSDMTGKRVNARNLIIIATSNAGSDLIWQFMQSEGSIKDHKDDIINAIVNQGIFRPELLNRFDGVILFHPISGDYLRQIAKVMLERFKKRLRSRGIDLVINDELIDYLMTFGNDPKFGARPMNRAIQDKVEQRLADKIIKGEIKPGQKIAFSEAELKGEAPVDSPAASGNINHA